MPDQKQPASIRLAVFGTGRLAEAHCRSFRAAGAAIRGVYSRDPSRARALAEDPTARVFASVDDVAGDASTEGAIIATETPRHYEAAAAMVAAGKAVFCEKPVTRTREEAHALQAQARRTGAFFSVGHVLRYTPAYRTARRLVRDGALGRIRHAACTRFASLQDIRPWMHNDEESGGCLLDLAVHDVDFLLWSLGPVAEARGALDRDRPETAARAGVLRLDFAGGATAEIRVGWKADEAFHCGFQLDGEGHSLSWDSRSGVAPQLDGAPVAVAAPEAKPADEQAADWLACRLAGRPAPVPLSEAAAALEVCLSGIESAQKKGDD